MVSMTYCDDDEWAKCQHFILKFCFGECIGTNVTFTLPLGFDFL